MRFHCSSVMSPGYLLVLIPTTYEKHPLWDSHLAASHGADLYWLMEKLRFLIKACFLAEAGFSEQKILTLFERNPLYQHVRQLESVREAGRGSSSPRPPTA